MLSDDLPALLERNWSERIQETEIEPLVVFEASPIHRELQLSWRDGGNRFAPDVDSIESSTLVVRFS